MKRALYLNGDKWADLGPDQYANGDPDWLLLVAALVFWFCGG